MSKDQFQAMLQASNFVQLEEALKRLPDQVDIDPEHKPYVTFKRYALARVGDERVIEELVVKQLAKSIYDYCDKKSGRIYWRTKLHWGIMPAEIATKFYYGPNIDLDKNWMAVYGFCRFMRAHHVTVETYFECENEVSYGIS